MKVISVYLQVCLALCFCFDLIVHCRNLIENKVSMVVARFDKAQLVTGLDIILLVGLQTEVWSGLTIY